MKPRAHLYVIANPYAMGSSRLITLLWRMCVVGQHGQRLFWVQLHGVASASVRVQPSLVGIVSSGRTTHHEYLMATSEWVGRMALEQIDDVAGWPPVEPSLNLGPTLADLCAVVEACGCRCPKETVPSDTNQGRAVCVVIDGVSRDLDPWRVVTQPATLCALRLRRVGLWVAAVNSRRSARGTSHQYGTLRRYDAAIGHLASSSTALNWSTSVVPCQRAKPRLRSRLVSPR